MTKVVAMCMQIAHDACMPNATNKHPNTRMNPGGDLYKRPLTRVEMTAPLAWHEKQLAVVRRYGELADGTIGVEVVCRAAE